MSTIKVGKTLCKPLKKADTAAIQAEMSKITSQIEQLKEWEKQFDSFLNEQRTLTQNYRQSTEQMKAEKFDLIRK